MSAGARVLLVEDEALIALDVQDMLAQAAYAVAGPAPSVAAALAIIEKEQIDAALLDVSLTDGVAWPVADALAARGAPFALLTGFGALVEAPERHAAVPVVQKPVNPEKLVEAIRSLLTKG
jgi:DNA-binding NtrC family response regulator